MANINIEKYIFNKIEAKDEVEQYYNFLNIENNNHILNPGFKSSQVNINSFIRFKQTLDNNKNPEYYFNLHPLKQPNSRKNNNVDNFHLIGLDIERAEKTGKETLLDLDKVRTIIYSDIINKYKLTNYILIFSGNGYHLYIMLNNKYSDKDETNINLNKLYGSLITQLSKSINPFIKITDRKDLASILRIPTTYNTKADRVVKIIDFKNESYNTKFQKEIDLFYNNFITIKPEETKSVIYQNKKDIFFTSILVNRKSWDKWIPEFNKLSERNNHFFKNLAIFIVQNPELKSVSLDFFNKWNSSRIPEYEGWLDKAKNMSISYGEIKNWLNLPSNKNFLSEWRILLEQQLAALNNSIFDNYEFYLLSDEREGMDNIIYYKNSDLYTACSFLKVIEIIFSNLKYRNINIAKELKLDLSEKWETLSYDQKVINIKKRIKTIIINEKRILIDNISYKPTNEHIFELRGKKYLNKYRKSEIWDYYNKKNEYSFIHIESILMNLCENNKKYYNYFNKWLAHIIQNPLEKMSTAFIFQGKPGSGKSIFTTIILEKIFNSNLFPVSQTLLDSPYNDYMEAKQICIGNEVIHNDSKYKTPEILKTLVTDQNITINEKFKNTRNIISYTHWIFCSNKEIPIYIEPDDRRYIVFNSLPYRYNFLSEEKTGEELNKFLKKYIDIEVKEYISYLKDIDLSEFSGFIPIMTKAKKDIIKINKSYPLLFIDNIREYENINEFILSENLNGLVESNIVIQDEFISKNNLYELYNKWCLNNGYKYPGTKNKFSRHLNSEEITDDIKSINISNDINNKVYRTSRVYSLKYIFNNKK